MSPVRPEPRAASLVGAPPCRRANHSLYRPDRRCAGSMYNNTRNARPRRAKQKHEHLGSSFPARPALAVLQDTARVQSEPVPIASTPPLRIRETRRGDFWCRGAKDLAGSPRRHQRHGRRRPLIRGRTAMPGFRSPEASVAFDRPLPAVAETAPASACCVHRLPLVVSRRVGLPGTRQTPHLHF